MARIAGINTNFDNINSATISAYMAKRYQNHVPSHHPVLYKIFARGQAKKGHGYKYVFQFRHPSPIGNVPVGVTDGFANIADPVERGGFTAYEWTPAMFAMNMGIEIYDIEAQDSETTLIDLYESRAEASFDTWDEFYQASIWALEATAGSGGASRTALCSIRTLFNGGGTSSTAGGVPDAKATQKVAAVGTTPLTLVGNVERNGIGGYYECVNLITAATNPSVTFLSRLYNMCVRNGEAPDLIILPEILYSYFDAQLAANQRYGESELAKIGFEAFRFKKAEVVMDDGCPQSANANQIFVINTKYLHLRYNTMKPKFVRKDFPNKTLQNWQGTHILQLCSDYLGRTHARASSVNDPS